MEISKDTSKNGSCIGAHCGVNINTPYVNTSHDINKNISATNTNNQENDDYARIGTISITSPRRKNQMVQYIWQYYHQQILLPYQHQN